MKKTYKKFKETELTKSLDQFNAFFYICGFKGFWVSDLKLPKQFVKIFDKILIVSALLITAMMFSNFVTYFTQKNLTTRQLADLNLAAACTPGIYHDYLTFLYYKREVRDILYHLVVVLKEDYYNKESVKQVIMKMKLYIGVFGFACSSAIFERAVSGILNVILYDEIFIPYVTPWPDPNESSLAALTVRVVYYIATWCQTVRAFGTYSLILLLLLILSYQFKDLQSYFHSLDLIFQDKNLTHEEKQKKYEEDFKKGISLHVLSLWLVRRCQYVCGTIYSSQLLLLTTILTATLIPIIVSDELATKLPHIPISIAILIVLALIMCSSGNITFEAQLVTDAMYASGWHNCHGSSAVRVRKMVKLAMLQAQQPVVLTAFSVIELSYENWIKVVKSSYSVLSVFS